MKKTDPIPKNYPVLSPYLCIKGAAQVKVLTDMFYGDRSGTLKDPFGHVWMFATHIEDVPPKELMKGSKEALGKMAAGKTLPS